MFRAVEHSVRSCTRLVEYFQPVKLGGQVVEKRTDLDRAADEHAQLTKSMNSTTDAVHAAADDTATFHCTLHNNAATTKTTVVFSKAYQNPPNLPRHAPYFPYME